MFVVQSQSSLTLWPHGLEPARLLCLWDFSGKDTGVGCHFLFQGIFLTQGLNPHLLLGRWVLYHWATWEVPTFMFRGNQNIDVACFFCVCDTTLLPWSRTKPTTSLRSTSSWVYCTKLRKVRSVIFSGIFLLPLPPIPSIHHLFWDSTSI